LGCHDALTQADGLELSNASVSFNDLVGRVSNCAGRVLVVAGNPDASYLLDKLGQGSQAPCGSTMPLAQPPLTSAQVSLVRDWIAAGAMGPLTQRFDGTDNTTTSSTTTTTDQEASR
jgi:hypothetical protein